MLNLFYFDAFISGCKVTSYFSDLQNIRKFFQQPRLLFRRFRRTRPPDGRAVDYFHALLLNKPHSCAPPYPAARKWGNGYTLLYIRPSEGFSNKELSGVDNSQFMIFNRLSPLLSARRISTAIAYGFHSPPTRLQKVSFYCVKDSRSHNKRPCIRS